MSTRLRSSVTYRVRVMKQMNKQIIIIPSFILGLVVVWLISIYMPLNKEIGNLKMSLETLKEKERQIVPGHRVQVVRKSVDSLSTEIINLTKRLYPEDKLLELGQLIDEIGTAYSLSLVSVTPDYESLSLFKEEGNGKSK